MRSVAVLMIGVAGFLVAAGALAGEAALELVAATGIVDKVDKDAVTIQPRGAGGKFAKKMVLKITGTSKLAAVTREKRGGKLVPVQRDVDAKDLEPNQSIAVIYLGGAEPTLLSAVVQRPK
jgi:hypothetical protein